MNHQSVDHRGIDHQGVASASDHCVIPSGRLSTE